MRNPIGIKPIQAKILEPNENNLKVLAHAIQKDELVGMPTETVYGLAGNAFSTIALTRIFESKERPTFDPLIIHIGNELGHLSKLEDAQIILKSKLTSTIQNQIQKLMDSFWPGPLTLILPKHPKVPDLATSGLQTVALRMPKHPLALKLIEAAGTPLAAPSANRFGRISPTSPEDVMAELGDRIPWILNGGPCTIGVESTILGLNENNDWTIFRPGGTPQEQVEKVLNLKLAQSKSEPGKKMIQAPGMLESHYAPQKKLTLISTRISELTSQTIDQYVSESNFHLNLKANQPVGLLLMSGDSDQLGTHFGRLIRRPVIARSLSKTGDLQDSARHLFSELRYLDSSDVETIFVEFCFSNQGLGYAISDRLRRASAPKHAKASAP